MAVTMLRMLLTAGRLYPLHSLAAKNIDLANQWALHSRREEEHITKAMVSSEISSYFSNIG
jgi:hypothetical protein